MILIDTHVWLWLVSDPTRLSRPARAALRKAARIGVCTISCWEIGMLVAGGRIKIDGDLRPWIRQASTGDPMETIPLTAEIATSAALMPNSFPGDPADRIIYATAVALSVPLVTKDERISSFDPQRTIW